LKYGQTNPPSIPVPDLFKDKPYPLGEVCDYKDEYEHFDASLTAFSNRYRTTSAEKRELERLESDSYEDLRLAAEVHRQVCLR
jgi:methionyl aminopeptidase